jgi:uncharacterized membrane protein
MNAINNYIDITTIIVEIIAVAIIVIGLLYGTLKFLLETSRKTLSAEARFTRYRQVLGKALLLGLEILVAADVIRTVVLELTLENVTVLGILVLIRTFLSWSLEVEIEGRWPWQSKAGER